MTVMGRSGKRQGAHSREDAEFSKRDAESDNVNVPVKRSSNRQYNQTGPHQMKTSYLAFATSTQPLFNCPHEDNCLPVLSAISSKIYGLESVCVCCFIEAVVLEGFANMRLLGY